MSRTQIIGYASLADAQAKAAFYSTDHRVMIVGPTDQVMIARENKDGVIWRSGSDADLYLMIATRDDVAGPLDVGD